MSGYGYAFNGAEYGYESDGAGHSYYSSNLGGSDATREARAELTGPGSSAYSQEGNVTSYAHEGYNGGLFQQTTLEYGGSYRIASSYSYAACYTYYGAADYPVGSQSDSPYTYSSYSYAIGSDRYGISSYGLSSRSDARYGGYDHESSTFSSLYRYADGSYSTSYHTSSGLFSYSGEAIPGTATSYASYSNYDATTGYLSTSHTP